MTDLDSSSLWTGPTRSANTIPLVAGKSEAKKRSDQLPQNVSAAIPTIQRRQMAKWASEILTESLGRAGTTRQNQPSGMGSPAPKI